jgi:hypothetical protein
MIPSPLDKIRDRQRQRRTDNVDALPKLSATAGIHADRFAAVIASAAGMLRIDPRPRLRHDVAAQRREVVDAGVARVSESGSAGVRKPI